MKRIKDKKIGFMMMIFNIYIWLMKIDLTKDKTNIEFVEFIVLIGFLSVMFYGYLVYFNKSRMRGLNIILTMPLLIGLFYDLVNNIQNKNSIINIIITLIMFIYISVIEIGSFNIDIR